MYCLLVCLFQLIGLFFFVVVVVFNLQVVSSKQRVKPPSVGTAN